MKNNCFYLIIATIFWTLYFTSSSFAQFTGGIPRPGDVYKEFAFNNNTTNWRVTDPNTANSGAIPYLPNPILPLANLSADDLQGTIKAELVIDFWGGHYGTHPKMLRVNGNDWVTIPELDELPTAPPPVATGENYMQQVNHLIEVPVSQLLEGQNTLEGTCGPNPWDWGQWGWYGAILRIYYDSSKPHATGQITSPVSGSTFGDNPTITADVSGNVNRVDFLANYEGYDSDGDGVFTDWHRNYHRESWTSPISIRNHVGTVTSAPFQLTWNTQWIPDQPSGQVKFIARIRDNNNIWFVTDEVSNLTLQRTDFSVKLFKPEEVPQSFWVRDGQVKSSKVNISNLSYATAAVMHVATWNGNDGSNEFYSKVNNWTAPKYGSNSFHSYDQVSVPLSALTTGENLITFSSSTIHHGIEIMWPGPAIVVQYDLVGATRHTLDVTTSGSGTVSLNPPGGEYYLGTLVELTAEPLTGWGFSGWSGDLSGTANPTTLTMNSDKNVMATFIVDNSANLGYAPVTPCRIVDTRIAGEAISPGTIRGYNVWGDVASQGGNSAGCPSPSGEPYGVHINVTAVPVSGSGNLQAYSFGSAAPSSSLVNYKSDAQNIANGGTLKTCFNCEKDINIKSNYGTTHVVIDVLGYYFDNPYH